MKLDYKNGVRKSAGAIMKHISERVSGEITHPQPHGIRKFFQVKDHYFTLQREIF